MNRDYEQNSYLPVIGVHSTMHLMHAEETYRLTLGCDTIDYDVPRDGMYYFVFYLSGGSFATVNVDFVINCLLYDVQPDNIVHESSLSTPPAQLTMPEMVLKSV